MFSLTSVLLSVSLSLPLPLKNKTKQKTMKILLGALGEQGPSEHRRVGHQEVEMPGPGRRAEVGPSQMEKSGRQCQGLHEVGWHDAQQGCVGAARPQPVTKMLHKGFTHLAFLRSPNLSFLIFRTES